MTTSTGFGYPIKVGRGILDQLVPLLEELSPAHGYALIADQRVFELHGERITDLCSGMPRPPQRTHLSPGGDEQGSGGVGPFDG